MKHEEIFKAEAEEIIAETEQKNRDFVQVYPKGWDVMLSLPSKSPHVARLYAFLAKHIAPLGGAVCVSYDTMAEALGISKMTARRAAEFLVNNGVVVRFKMGTGAFIYAMNPEEVWKSADKHKKYAAFYTKSLVLRRDTEALEAQVKMLGVKPAKNTKRTPKPTKGSAKSRKRIAKPQAADDIGELAKELADAFA